MNCGSVDRRRCWFERGVEKAAAVVAVVQVRFHAFRSMLVLLQKNEALLGQISGSSFSLFIQFRGWIFCFLFFGWVEITQLRKFLLTLQFSAPIENEEEGER